MLKFLTVFLLSCFVVSFSNAQVIVDSVLIEGHYRVFHFHKPPESVHRASLIFVLHGSGGNGLGMMNTAAKMEQQANAKNALVVYPDGYKRYWNECRKLSPAEANVENINEQSFFDGMIQYFT